MTAFQGNEAVAAKLAPELWEIEQWVEFLSKFTTTNMAKAFSILSLADTILYLGKNELSKVPNAALG